MLFSERPIKNRSLWYTINLGSFQSSFAFLDQHDVWVWGYGILGQGEPAQHSAKPLLLPPTLFGRNEFNTDAVTTSVSCGVNTSAAINSYGDLYTWGKNKGSCLGLGLGSNLDQYFPLKVNLGGQVKKVCLGFDHSIAMCKPYVWLLILTL